MKALYFFISTAVFCLASLWLIGDGFDRGRGGLIGLMYMMSLLVNSFLFTAVSRALKCVYAEGLSVVLPWFAGSFFYSSLFGYSVYWCFGGGLHRCYGLWVVTQTVIVIASTLVQLKVEAWEDANKGERRR